MYKTIPSPNIQWKWLTIVFLSSGTPKKYTLFDIEINKIEIPDSRYVTNTKIFLCNKNYQEILCIPTFMHIHTHTLNTNTHTHSIQPVPYLHKCKIFYIYIYKEKTNRKEDKEKIEYMWITFINFIYGLTLHKLYEGKDVKETKKEKNWRKIQPSKMLSSFFYTNIFIVIQYIHL